MKAIRTWVLIADAGRARVYETRGKGTGLTVVQDVALDADLPPSRALGTDRPGRSFDSVGSGRHAMESPSDAHREEKRRFARRLAAALDECRAAERFDRLVIVAPAVTMGDLRAILSDQLRTVVKAEVVADLTKVPFSELPRHLTNHVDLRL